MEADLLKWTIWKPSGSKSRTFIVMSQLGECQTSQQSAIFLNPRTRPRSRRLTFDSLVSTHRQIETVCLTGASDFGYTGASACEPIGQLRPTFKVPARIS